MTIFRRHRIAMSRAASVTLIIVTMIVVIGAVSIADVVVTATRPANSTVTTTASTLSNATGGLFLDQKPVVHYITVTWEKSPQALQDRFTPFNIVVAQGDTIHITFIVNDTSAHTFTIGQPYNFQMNVTVPGLTNDLTGDFQN